MDIALRKLKALRSRTRQFIGQGLYSLWLFLAVQIGPLTPRPATRTDPNYTPSQAHDRSDNQIS